MTALVKHLLIVVDLNGKCVLVRNHNGGLCEDIPRKYNLIFLNRWLDIICEL